MSSKARKSELDAPNEKGLRNVMADGGSDEFFALAAAPCHYPQATALPQRNYAPLAPKRNDEAALLAAQGGDLIFDAQLLPFKFRDHEVVGMRSVFFFVDEIFEFSMLGPQRFHALCHGHA